MKISIMTLFPEMCNAVLGESIIGRAREKGIIEIEAVNIRDYTTDKHNNVDDATYGGGMGMLMQAQPIYDCYKAIAEKSKSEKPHLIYMSPQGKTLTQQRVKELSELDEIVILCGHYEGVDERVLEEIVDEEISVGDYVLTGGELPALMLADAVARMIDGVLPNDEAKSLESHYDGLLEYPQYTRPFEWHGKEVPEVLISGHHENIDKWRRQQSLKRTFERRPDMLEKAELTKKDLEYLETLRKAELWDAYDKSFTLIPGLTLERGKRIPDGVFHLVCDIIVQHTDGTYLLMQRDKRKHFGGMWEATAGGSALMGESPAECAKRELCEETGIISDSLTEVGRVVNSDNHSIYVEFYCRTDCDKRSIVLQDGETSAFKWVSAQELISMKKDELVTERMQNFVDELKV